MLFDPVPGYRARAVHGVHRTVAVTRPWGGRGADASRVRALLPPGLRARGFTKRAEGVSRTHVPKLPVFLDARAVREAFGTKETTPGEAHAERARAHHGFGGVHEKRKLEGPFAKRGGVVGRATRAGGTNNTEPKGFRRRVWRSRVALILLEKKGLKTFPEKATSGVLSVRVITDDGNRRSRLPKDEDVRQTACARQYI